MYDNLLEEMAFAIDATDYNEYSSLELYVYQSGIRDLFNDNDNEIRKQYLIHFFDKKELIDSDTQI